MYLIELELFILFSIFFFRVVLLYIIFSMIVSVEIIMVVVFFFFLIERFLGVFGGISGYLCFLDVVD